MTAKLPTIAVTVPINKPPVHVISQQPDGTYALTNSDNGRTRIFCADIKSANLEKARLDALAAQEKF